LRFAELEEWGLRDSSLHRRDPRSKILAVLLLLIAIGRGHFFIPAVAIAAALAVARLPVHAVLLRACVVLPFSLSFVVAGVLAGEHDRAGSALWRSYLSAVSVVVLLGCTPLPSLLDGFHRLGAPSLLLEVIQFVYRYLTLIGEQAKRMTVAATARGAKRSLAAVGGSVGVLFARSYDRADAIHRSMMARGYTGSLPARPLQWSFWDGALIAISVVILAASFVWNPLASNQ
jgi:cobalt/nickel transport system permease protein